MIPLSRDDATSTQPGTAKRFGDPQPLVESHTPEPLRAPELPRSIAEQLAGRARAIRKIEGAERRSMLRGLILLALTVLLFSLLHAGIGRVFPAGWLRRW